MEKEYAQRIESSNNFMLRAIDEYGIEWVKKKLLNNIPNLDGHEFINFLKDIKNWNEYAICNKQNNFPIDINKIKKHIIIFEMIEDDKIYNIKHTLRLPFNNFFIATNIVVQLEEDPNEIYLINGFLVTKDNTKYLNKFSVFYVWSQVIGTKWGISIVHIDNNMLEQGSYLKGIETVPNSINTMTSKIGPSLSPKLFNLLKKLLYLIDKKEYTTYKKWNNDGSLSTHNIVYASEVKGHKRHFWEDSGRFNIPLWDKEKQIAKGYFIDEVVYRDGELRRDVPYKLIDSYTINADKEKKEEQRKISLIKKTIYKNEKQLGEILYQIFPNEFISKHNRKVIKGLELDYYLPKLRLAFEYDGEQHFDSELYFKLYGEGFEEQVKRDKKKNSKCKSFGITLIRIRYDEPLTIEYINQKIKERIDEKGNIISA